MTTGMCNVCGSTRSKKADGLPLCCDDGAACCRRLAAARDVPTPLTCGARTKSVMGYCDRPVPRHGDRCWQHCGTTPEKAAVKKKERMARFSQQEREADVRWARRRFLDAALAHGLRATATVKAFHLLQDALAALTIPENP